ncbi:hypothetical protein A8C56_12400 [Niabella ginsenosidivorans]|uniref:SGNH hydrolase-type esterase domain-containing protein n=1 Tax=Niabella ginsenosidivorans TaxID=1176587 RepID=A0A1A9I233_9BACT|nr:SGNH/GDSL hydrolase family protein [Niabella ginsenosidivorans]ANH81676.1 hypothetical protein A8C56_12400 [Niabella ginsenosidivorans]
MKMRILAILLLVALEAPAQNIAPPLFKNGDIVCFVGNSITNNGEFYNFIYLYYATRYPNEKLRFINCGISGDVASGILKRLDSDVLIHHPTWCVLMVGMNDVKRTLYTEKNRNNPSGDQQKAEALAVYREKTEDIIKIFKQYNQGIILEKPTIYDQTAKLPEENFYGVNDALKMAGNHVEAMSKKYDTRLVDYWSIMNRINNELQEKDLNFTITGKDRVHPGSLGHFVMAYQFLKTLQPNKYVAKIVIGKNSGDNKGQSLNCKISNYDADQGKISFSCLENSLPFPIKPDAAEALKWVPFTDDLNQEVLQILNLDTGAYQLLIDGRPIAIYTAAQLRTGVNLAIQTNTPQYQQAEQILQLCMEYRKQESTIRNIKLVEFGRLADYKGPKDSLSVKNYLDQYLDSAKASGHLNFYKTQFDNYLRNKPNEAVITRKLNDIADKIYAINKPIYHQFKLVKK